MQHSIFYAPDWMENGSVVSHRTFAAAKVGVLNAAEASRQAERTHPARLSDGWVLRQAGASAFVETKGRRPFFFTPLIGVSRKQAH
jgi:hypothetical protein